MNRLFSGFRILGGLLLLSLIFQLNVQAQAPEAGDTPPPAPEAAETADADEEDDNCGSNPYSLYSALKSAQNVQGDGAVIIPNGLPGSTQSKDIGATSALAGVAGLLQRIINGLTAIAAAVAVFFIVFNGGGMLLAVGDTERIKKAREGIMWALLGLLLIMGSYVIAKTAISLTYSGSNQMTEGSNFSIDCKDEEDSGTPEDPVPAACEADFMNNIPAACYDGDVSAVQSRTDAECSIESFQPVCDLMSAEGDLSGECSMENIQSAMGAGQPGTDFYADPSARCAQSDGKYGRCTRDALNNYLGDKCSAGASE